MQLNQEERNLFEFERKAYIRLLGDIRKSRGADNDTICLTCLGNAGGADAVVKGYPTGGLLMSFRDRIIAVDPGANSLPFLTQAGFDPYQITDVIVSHSHDDHVGDLSAFISSALQLNLVDKRDANILVPPTLIDYENSKSTQYGFTLPEYSWGGRVRALYWKDVKATSHDGKTVRSITSADIGTIGVRAVEARHREIPSTGLLFTTPVGKIGYTADTEFFPELVECYQGCDVLWMNISTLGLNSIDDDSLEISDSAGSIGNHLGYYGVCKLIEGVRPATVIVSHFGSHLLGKVDQIQTLLRERLAGVGTQIFCAQNGNTFVFKNTLKDQINPGSLCP